MSSGVRSLELPHELLKPPAEPGILKLAALKILPRNPAARSAEGDASAAWVA
jgi:hypothetical protein